MSPIRGTSEFDVLRQPPGPNCWWCQHRPATTGEHKYKQTDLARLMGDDPSLFWVSTDEGVREIRGTSGIKRDRYRAVKFPKSLCGTCNNSRSQPFDATYSVYSEYIYNNRVSILPGIDLKGIFGEDWEARNLLLARYYAKHFGCRMVWQGIPVPESLRSFLNGAIDMQDCHMSFISTDEVKRQKSSLSLSPDGAMVNRDRTRFTGCVMVNYIKDVGVRFVWSESGLPEGASQFFHYPHPVITNFKTHEDVFANAPRKPGWFARFSQWINEPKAVDNTDSKRA